MLSIIIYLSRQFVVIWIGVVLAFLVLIGLLDSLANGGDIMAGDGTFTDTFRYMAYRAPVIFDRIFVFTIVVAILLTFAKLIRNHELVALLGFGISATKQFLCLLPIVTLAGWVSILLINILMPPSVAALQAWGIGEYKVNAVTDKNPLWMEDGSRIVRVASRPGMTRLGSLEIFNRDETGAVTDALWAERAEYEDKNEHWVLHGVQTLPIAGADGEPRMALRQTNPEIWDTKKNPKAIAKLTAEPRDLSLSDMRDFRERGNSGAKPRFAYGFWYLHRLTRPLAVIILLLCLVPIMQRTARQDNGDIALIIGVGTGFIFLIIDGALTTFATSGSLGVFWAIFFPLSLFAMLGAFLLLRTESHNIRSSTPLS